MTKTIINELITDPNSTTKAASEVANSNPKPLVSIVTVVYNRVSALQATMDSVFNQTYDNIEYIIVDGGSTDGTKDLIKQHEGRLATWISEPDGGIYDAINKGVNLAKGHYICLLHAGDIYSLNYISEAVKLGAASPDAIVYAGYSHGDKPVHHEVMNPGFFFHHMGINHLTFLVPAKLYRELGPYDVSKRIVSDHIWVRKSLLLDTKFIRHPDLILTFAPGGASTGDSESQRRLVIGENIDAFRAVFPFLPIDVAEAIYLYRFDEKRLWRIRDYCLGLQQHDFTHPMHRPFIDALIGAMKYTWSHRPLNVRDNADVSDQADVRVSFARMYGVPLSDANISSGGVKLANLLKQMDELKERFKDKRIVLHYLEVFSRPSETFVRDLIARLREQSGDSHIVLCDKRVLADERPFAAVFSFDYLSHPPFFSKLVIERFLTLLDPYYFVFHFAINGWRLLTRIDTKFQLVPAIYMTHGIDVFDLVKSSDYSSFIFNVVAFLPNAHFTSVSNFLKDRLIGLGIPPEKVTLLHNTIHKQFLDSRKAGRDKKEALLTSKFDVRLINIGRLVRWKGHDTLISALAKLRSEHKVNAHLTIVYGGDATELKTLEAQTKELKLQDVVRFIERVDFAKDRRFLSNFDLFVSASTYTADNVKQSETFGVSILEAIASGLPVVATDAGGQPEVVGPDSPYSRIVPHSDPSALAGAIAELVRSGCLDLDNKEFALSRLDQFSADKHYDGWKKVTERITAPLLKSLVISTNVDKGAGGAALRVHKSLLLNNVQSVLLCSNDSPARHKVPQVVKALRPPKIISDTTHPTGRFIHRGYTIFSIDTEGLPLAELEPYARRADVINLHWYARFISNRNIAWLSQLGKPVVITIRDMHPMAGGCHFFHGCDNWQFDCFPCPQFMPNDVHLPRATMRWKKENWDMNNITIVVLSDHSHDIIKRSALFGQCEIVKIPNPIDLDVFKPLSKAEARQGLGIDVEGPAAAYIPSFNSKVKGGTEVSEMFRFLKSSGKLEGMRVLTAGAKQADLDFGFPNIDLGYITDKKKLAMFYAAADVTIVPSLEETFSNTAVESISCGTPIAGFRTGAIPELASGKRGIAVGLGDSKALAEAVVSIVTAFGDVSQDCRTYVEESFSPDKIGHLYKSLFERLASKSTRVGHGDGAEAKNPVISADDPTIHYLAARLSQAEVDMRREPAAKIDKPKGQAPSSPDVKSVQAPAINAAQMSVAERLKLDDYHHITFFARDFVGRSGFYPYFSFRLQEFNSRFSLELRSRDIALPIFGAAHADGVDDYGPFVRIAIESGVKQPRRLPVWLTKNSELMDDLKTLLIASKTILIDGGNESKAEDVAWLGVVEAALDVL